MIRRDRKLPGAFAKQLGIQTVVRAGSVLSALCGRWAGSGCGILMYHRVVPDPAGFPAPTYNVSPQRFHSQLAGLLSRGYQPWPLRKILEHHRAGRVVPNNVFAVTFDDGYENVYRHAWPVLEQLHVPATIFLATAYLDSSAPFPFDDWSAAGAAGVPPECWRPLTTAHCHEMRNQGLLELGTHTHTHQDFRCRPQDLIGDLRASLEFLRDRFQLEDATFAFPHGDKKGGFAGAALSDAARQAGVLCSLTTENELVAPGSDPFDWGRFGVLPDDTALTLGAKLDGWYTLARDTWRRCSKPFGSTGEPLPAARRSRPSSVFESSARD